MRGIARVSAVSRGVNSPSSIASRAANAHFTGLFADAPGLRLGDSAAPCYHQTNAPPNASGLRPPAREDALRREMVDAVRRAAGRGRPPGARRDARGAAAPFRARSRSGRKAYGDHSLPIGYGQTISQPYVVGLMTQRLGVSSPGTRSSRSAPARATRRRCSRGSRARVYSLERIDELARGGRGDPARARLPQRLGQGLRRDVRLSGRGALRPDPRHGGDRRESRSRCSRSSRSAAGSSRPIGPPERQRIRVDPPAQDRLRAGGRRGGRLRAAARPVRRGTPA